MEVLAGPSFVDDAQLSTLVAEGRLDLDRTVQHYLPELLPASYPPITVRQVLTYQSGINRRTVPVAAVYGRP